MMRVRSYLSSSSGAVLVEALFVIPVLILLTFGTVQIGAIYYVLNTMAEITREGSRAMSVRRFDDETAGVVTNCADLTNTTASGLASVERYMCDRAQILPGAYRVAASDGATTGVADEGSTVTVWLEIDRSQVIFYDPFSSLLNSNTLSVRAVNVVE